MIEKKDWEATIAQLQAIKINDLISKQLSDNSFKTKMESYDNNIEFCKKKLSKFPDEDEEIKKEIKEDLKEVLDDEGKK